MYTIETKTELKVEWLFGLVYNTADIFPFIKNTNLCPY